MIKMKHLALTAAAIGLLTAHAQAAIISVNFSQTGETPLGAADSAGVIPAVNWNNVTTGNPGTTALNLKDNSGIATTADVTITMSGSGNTSPDITPAVTDPDTRMLIDEVRVFRNGSYSLSLADIPYAEYDLYAYFVDQSTSNSSSNTSITDGTTTYLFRTPGNDQSFFTSNGFVRSTDMTNVGNHDIGNFVLFEGLTGLSQVLALGLPTGGERIGISGIQIVEVVQDDPSAPVVPEPASALLASLGGLALLRRRRH